MSIFGKMLGNSIRASFARHLISLISTHPTLGWTMLSNTSASEKRYSVRKKDFVKSLRGMGQCCGSRPEILARGWIASRQAVYLHVVLSI